MSPLRIAVTADLHYGTRHTTGNRATQDIAERLRDEPPDLLILAGDIGAGDDFERCLALFDRLICRKAAVPGNHDIWVRSDDPRGDSLDLYDRVLPAICRNHGFTYLDQESLFFPTADLAVVGSMNWYDYTWDKDRLRQATADWQERLRTKRFVRGMHNDANFVRWPLDDVSFTDRVVAKLTADLQAALARTTNVLVVTHHPPLKGLLYPAPEPLTVDALLWRAFSGNTRVEDLLTAHADRVPLVFCGHTHAARDCRIGRLHGHNVGSDYPFKRLLWVDWPSGKVTAEEYRGEE